MSRRLVALLVALGFAVSGAGCSSAKHSQTASTDSTGGSATTDPEDLIVTDSQVTAGIAAIDDQVALVLATLSTDQAKAKATVQQVYDTWYGIEGAIKAHGTDAYLSLEDALGALKNGVDQSDLAKAQLASSEFSKAASDYLQQWPGRDGSSTTTAAAP